MLSGRSMADPFGFSGSIGQVGNVAIHEAIVHPLAPTSDAPALAATARARLRTHGVVRLSGFPVDPGAYMTFLRLVGCPIPRYHAAETCQAGEDTVEHFVNRVRYRPVGTGLSRVHDRADHLAVHSARSWRAPRPATLAMFMVDPGWRFSGPGLNGESRLVAWRDVLAAMDREDSTRFGGAWRMLSEVPVCFQADHVREPLSELPVLYRLAKTRPSSDFGVRLKYNIELQPPTLLGSKERQSWIEAVGWLRATAERCAVQFALERGEILLVDNDRVGHGRCAFQAVRPESPASHSPREVWSVTLDALPDAEGQ